VAEGTINAEKGHVMIDLSQFEMPEEQGEE
jgi:hypothetical protein